MYRLKVTSTEKSIDPVMG